MSRIFRSDRKAAKVSPARPTPLLAAGLLPLMDWRDVLRAEPAQPRPLHLTELRILARAGFPEVAQRLAAGTCTDCGHSRASSFHRERCEETLAPVPAAEQPRQPWEPRPARKAA